jgi:hypothetical protein
VQVLQKAWNLLSDDVKAILQSAESNLNALNTVHLGPKRPFSVGECALWARLTGPRFAGQVAAAVSLVEAPSNSGKAASVAKEVMAIMLGNKTAVEWSERLNEIKLLHPRPGELKLIQTHMTQKPMLRVEVGAVSCRRYACVAHKDHARENREAWASAARKALGCVCPCVRL